METINVLSIYLSCIRFYFLLDIIQLDMNQRPFSPVTGQAFKVENYYFQMILQKLIAKRPPKSGIVQFTFTPFRGSQKYESSKPVTLNLTSQVSYPLDAAKLNFVAISYNPAKSLSFDIRMILNNESIDKEIGEYQLDASSFIDHFVQSENGAFTLKIDFNDQWAAEAELYVQRTRYAVERMIRDIKNPKPKETVEAAPISHQSIQEKRRKLDLQQEEDAPHHQRFKKFSPKRESQQEIQKKAQHFSRKKEQERKENVPIQNAQKKEEKRSPKGQFVPKKQWIIPEAEKYMASKTKTTSRTNSLINTPAQKPPSVIKSEKEQRQSRVKAVEESSWLQKLPIQPKYLLIVIITIAVLIAFSVLKSDTPPVISPKNREAKGKKVVGKGEKPQKGGKVKK